MNCVGDEERINRYLDDELPPAERAQFEAHLADCPACQRALARQRALFVLLGSLAEEPAPADLYDAVLAGLPHRRAALPVRRVLAAQVAATAALLVLAWPTLQQAYTTLAARLPAGWLAALAVEVWTRLQEIPTRLRSALTVDVDLPLHPSLGLTWGQAALIAAVLLGLWLLSNRLLLGGRKQRGGTV